MTDVSNHASGRIAADIGGTFTDVTFSRADGTLFTQKLLSTVADYAGAVLDGFERILVDAGASPSSITDVSHATTLATNAILERTGARTGLLTTHGFRDVLELGRMRLPKQYHALYEKPSPLVERYLRRGILERIAADGRVLVPLDEQQAIAEIDHLLDQGVKAMAICLINAWANDEHERRLVELIAERDASVFCSTSAILPTVGEYERTSTAVVNSYVGPSMARYLERLATGLGDLGIHAPLRIMQSSGGVMSAQRAALLPANLVESGPAAGVIATQQLAARLGIGNCIAFDMGGTTAKASVIEDGEIHVSPDLEVGGMLSERGGAHLGGHGHTLGLPSIDIAEVGAGGGSIVYVDVGGALQVGPESAGAFPGPACYGFGGTQPTVTDANVVLGYINPEAIASGEVAIAADRARSAVAKDVAEPLGIGLEESAWAIHTVASSRMINAIRAVTTQRGRDAREFVLIAFGGSGPLHAAGMAELMEIRRVIVPPTPGLFSAVGLLHAARRETLSRSFFARLDEVDPKAVSATFGEIEARAFAELTEGDGSRAEVDFTRTAELRYVGQGHELSVDLEDSAVNRATLRSLVERFTREHHRTYGHAFKGADVEFVTVRVTATLDDGRIALETRPEGERRRRQRVAFFGDAGFVETPVLSRTALSRRSARGPLIIEEDNATTVVPPSWKAQRDSSDNIVMVRA